MIIIPPLSVYTLSGSITGDTTFQTLDLSNFVPAGVTAVLCEFYVNYNGGGGPDVSISFQYRTLGDTIGGIFNDGSSVVGSGFTTGAARNQRVWMRVGIDRKIQILRNNPHFRTSDWRVVLHGWQGGPKLPQVGSVSIEVPYSATPATNYPSFPWSLNTLAGHKLVAYRDWDGTNAADHNTGGAAWLKRDNAAPVLLWSATGVNGSTATPNTTQVNGWVLLRQPGTSNVVALLQTYASMVGTWFYAISSDDGLTWSVLTALPAFTGLPVGFAPFALFDFCPSEDGSKVYGTLYGTQGVESVALMESVDGFTWSFRSWIMRGLTLGANECAIVRLSSGRLLAASRASYNTDHGHTSFSVDDGVTWSTPVQGPSSWHGMRAIPSGVDCAVMAGRNFDVNANYSTSVWLLDRNGVVLAGPIAYFQNSNPSHGGYCAWIHESDIYKILWNYTDLRGAGPNLCKTPVTLQ